MTKQVSPPEVSATVLDLGYLGLFVGMRINDLVSAQLAASGYDGLKYSHGFVFQHLISEPRTITALAELLGMSQQAASKTVAELVELGYVDTAAGEDKRARKVELSTRGLAVLEKGRHIRSTLQRRLERKHGKSVADARALLAEVLGDLGGLEAVQQRRVREQR